MSVKTLLVFCMLCVCLNGCSNIKQTQYYTNKVQNETTINSLVIQEHVIIVEYQNKERVHNQAYLNARIMFPQILDMNDRFVQDKINKLLKQAAFQFINHADAEETLKLFNAIIKGNLVKEVWSGENEYKIIYIDDESISLNYSGDSFWGGANPSHFSNYVTINLSNGTFIPFTDCFLIDSVIDAIKLKKFEWIEGQYTGGYNGHEPEVISAFVKIFNQLADSDTKRNIYDSISTYNFAMDEQFAYIGIPFDDSLDGYVTLKFNFSDLN